MTPLRTTDLTHTLVAGLKEMISSGVLHPGARFPPERELARKFGVNRASIRQALKALDVMGVVYQRVGDGTYLTHDASATLSYPLEFLILMDRIEPEELMDARMIVEPELAARAAKRATDEQITALEKLMDEAETATASGATEKSDHDLRFHELIWRASGNRVCDRMFSSIHKAMLPEEEAQNDQSGNLSPHRKIAVAIKNHDEEGARQEMRNHLRANMSHSGAQAGAHAGTHPGAH